MNQLPPQRQELVRRIFFSSADDDYICARSAAMLALYRHFSWHAAQCLEKYVKCIIVLNDEPALFGHSFFKHAKSKVFARMPKVFPAEIDVSKFTPVHPSRQSFAVEDLLACLERFEKMGIASVRYNTATNRVQPYDLQKLDRLVFLLRRLCVKVPGHLSIEEHVKMLETDLNFTTATHWPTVVHSNEPSERKREALMHENSANFPELLGETKGAWFAAFDASVQSMMDMTGRMSGDDKAWLQRMIKL